MDASDRPPVVAIDPGWLDPGGGRERAPVTIRVAAIGESALTLTPGGVVSPICHVSAATARLAQPYAPVLAARHPEPEVTPRIRPCPASVMMGSAAPRT